MGSQCKGITKSGAQCKMTGVFTNGFCRLHQNQYSTESKQDPDKLVTVNSNQKYSSPKENLNEKQPSDLKRCYNYSHRFLIGKKVLFCSVLLIVAISWISNKFIKQHN